MQFLMQVFCWRFYLNFDPHQQQYDRMVEYLDRADCSRAAFAQMVGQITTPYMYCSFAMLELFTALYVWSELLYPPVACVVGFQLSTLYYPLLMTLSDMLKLNIAACMRSFDRKAYGRAISALFSVHIFFFYCMVTLIQSYCFLAGALGQMLQWVGYRSQCTAAPSADDKASHPEHDNAI